VTLPSNLQLRSLTPEDQSWLEPFIVEHWGAREVVVHNTVYLPATLPGFAAEIEGQSFRGWSPTRFADQNVSWSP